MKVYRVRFVLAGEDHTRETYIHARDAEEALKKLGDRFPGEPREIHIESIEKHHGKFIIGSEEQVF